MGCGGVQLKGYCNQGDPTHRTPFAFLVPLFSLTSHWLPALRVRSQLAEPMYTL